MLSEELELVLTIIFGLGWLLFAAVVGDLIGGFVGSLLGISVAMMSFAAFLRHHHNKKES